MSKVSAALILTFGFGLVWSQVTVPCRKTTITPMRNFDIDKFTGKEWYDIAFITSYMNVSGPGEINKSSDYKCPSMSVSESEVPGVYRVNLVIQLVKDSTEEHHSNLIHLNLKETAVNYYTLHKGNGTDIIIDTDYKTWVLTYGCAIYDGKTYEYINIKSRTRALDKAVYDKLVSRAIDLGFAKDKLVLENQSECGETHM